MRRTKCRLWWPSNLSSQGPYPNSSCFLFGWFISSSEASLDVVVSFARDESKLSSSIDLKSNLQEILQKTNKNLAALLHDKSKFSLLGYYEVDLSGNGMFCRSGNDKNNCINLSNDRHHSHSCAVHHQSWICGCPKLNGSLEQGSLAAPESMWIKLVYGLSETTGRRVRVIPKLDHAHRNGETIFQLDLHVIVYEIPSFGGHHYSLGIQGLSNLETSFKTPKWFDQLHRKDPQHDLDSVIRAINSAKATQLLFAGHCQAEPASCLVRFTTFGWELFSLSVASLSTVIYIILQSSNNLSGWVSHSCISIILAKLLSKTCKNIQVRCCQLVYWPVLLQDHSTRYSSCVEFAEKASFRKHLVWSNVLVDVLLGIFFGVALWFMAEPVCLWVSNFSLDITNYWLRTGCVWLMGDPAGFKLNNELAGILGMISLTAVQIWSTLWGYTGFLLIYCTKGLSLCGILFGLTTAAALVIDTISLVTMHIWALHLFLALLYSTQIKAVAALWRLFRGKKWNPLRHRLDSYDYTVEQHVVGSLLFTPIFLLLPTTSAFYIFFTILYTAVCITCIVVEVAISFIHASPYAKILLWLKSKRRFPSGIRFEVTSCRYSETGTASSDSSSSGELQKIASASNEAVVLLSVLHSNYLNLGEIVWPHYKEFFSTFSWSYIASSAHGLLSGKSIPSSLGVDLSLKLPWMKMPWKEYWRLCHDSVYSCRRDPYNQFCK